VRVAVVAGPAAGHALPAAGLALGLRAAGADPLVVTGAEWRPALARDGIAASALPALAPDPRDGDFGYLLWGRSVEMAPELAATLAVERVDAVVADTLTVAGAFAAELAGVPWLELVPHLLPDSHAGRPPAGTGLRPGRTPLGEARDAVLRHQHDRALARGREQRAGARRALGLPDSGGRPLRRLVATLPALEPARRDWPGDAVVVGPLDWDPAGADLAAPPGDAPLVVVSESTATGAAAGLFDAALVGLARSGLRLAATRFSPYPGRLPAWAVAGRGRQRPLLAAAAASGGAIVCGGGHGMVAKGLLHGLPLVVVPRVGDQRGNAARVAELGAGVVVAAGRLTPARLAAAVREVVDDPAYAAAARRAGSSGAGLGTAYAAGVVLAELRRRESVRVRT
jgi:UDP:flavonoid glycosyltransferase YjiC (YdhE family)